MRTTISILLLLLRPFGGTPEGALAQQAPAERLFDSGIAAFRSGDYALAASAFTKASESQGRNPVVTAALIMAAKAEYRAGRYDDALARARRLLDRYTRSAYRPDAWYIAALSEYRTGTYDIAASSALTIVREHPGTRFAPRAAELFADVTASHLPLSELKRLSSAGLPPELHGLASIALARGYVRRGEDSLAAAVLAGITPSQNGGRPVPDVAALRDEVGAGSAVQVAVLLPLGGGEGDEGLGALGSEILDGVRAAADAFNAGEPAGRRVEIVLRDVGTDTAAASAAVEEAARTATVRAVVGPVFSGAFAAAATAANARHLPIISPTATGDRIAAEGPFVFQANPDNETRGRGAATYAVEVLHMSSFVVMASDDPVGRSHALAFAERARELGATVYVTVLFPPEATDLRREFSAVRRAVMADRALVLRADLARPAVADYLAATGADTLPAFRDSTADSLSVTALFGARGYVIAESLGVPIAAEDTTAEEIDVPMVTADGMYVALGDPGQLDYVAPQLDYFNIRAQVIGNNEWYDPERLRENRAALDGVLFLSDFDDGKGEPAAAEFTASFLRRHGRAPTKFTLYGYDTMRLVLDQVGAGARTRPELARRLAAVDNFPGLHAPISLRDGRVNRYLHVMKFEGGSVRPIGSASGGER